MRIVCALSYSKVPHGLFIGFPWCSRVPKSKCGNNMKFVHVGNYRQRQGFDTRYFLHIASAMRVLTFCNTGSDRKRFCRCSFFVFHSCLLSWSLPSLPLPPCLPVLSPHSPSLPPHFKSDKKSSLSGVYMGLCRCNLWIPCQSPKLRQNQQNMSKKYMANSKIITHMAGLKPKSQWYRINIRFMPNKKNQDY